MSRTDKTDPWPMRAIKDPKRLLREFHHHEGKDCDLPELDVDSIGWAGGLAEGGGRSCYWEYTAEFLYGKDSGCGCPMCSAHNERRDDRRRSRHESNQDTHDMVREMNALPSLGANRFLPGVDELTDAESDLVAEHQNP